MAFEKEVEESLENVKKLMQFYNIRLRVVTRSCIPGSSSGDNFMSVVKRLIVECLDSDGNEVLVKLIVKRQIASLSRRQLYRCDEAFSNEIAAFNNIVPMLQKYTPGRELLFPKCYFAGSDSSGEIILLEDLKVKGFSMASRMHGLDFEHCQLVMQELAKLHAASIGAKRDHCSEFHVKLNYLCDIVYCDEGQEFFKNVLDSSVDEALCSLRTSNTDESLTEAIRLIELIQPNLFEKLKVNITQQQAPNTVICHGDLWINNMMFQNDPTTGRPITVRLLDLQTMRYSSPVFDILHFVYTSTKRDMRDVYLTQILETYCKSILYYIDQQNYPDVRNDLEDIKNSFSLQSITKDFQDKVLYGLAVAMWILPAVTFDGSNLPNLDLLSENNQHGKELKCTQKLTPEYHCRIKELVLEFYENGFLKDLD